MLRFVSAGRGGGLAVARPDSRFVLLSNCFTSKPIDLFLNCLWITWIEAQIFKNKQFKEHPDDSSHRKGGMSRLPCFSSASKFEALGVRSLFSLVAPLMEPENFLKKKIIPKQILFNKPICGVCARSNIAEFVWPFQTSDAKGVLVFLGSEP